MARISCNLSWGNLHELCHSSFYSTRNRLRKRRSILQLQQKHSIDQRNVWYFYTSANYNKLCKSCRVVTTKEKKWYIWYKENNWYLWLHIDINNYQKYGWTDSSDEEVFAVRLASLKDVWLKHGWKLTPGQKKNRYRRSLAHRVNRIFCLQTEHTHKERASSPSEFIGQSSWLRNGLPD